MIFYLKSIIIVVILLSAFKAESQNASSSRKTFEHHLTQVNKLLKVYLMADALIEIDLAFKKASTPEQKVKSIVTKGEILRASGAYQLALECLWIPRPKQMNQVSTELRIKHLGRLAAVHQEYGAFAEKSKADSVLIYIDSAFHLALSHPNKNQLEIASLYNEIGLYVYRKGKTLEAREYFKKSCNIFEKLNENELLVTPMSNLLELESCSRNRSTADSISLKLEKIIEGKSWYRVKTIAYNSLAIASRVKKDKEAAINYQLKLYENTHANLLETNSEKMLVLRELFERDKLEQQVESEKLINEKKARQLEISAKDQQQLYLLLLIALIIIAGIIFLLFRERRLKTQIKRINDDLNKANERYELLVIESNHRIKNNLQMISAMLDYTKKGLDDGNHKIIQSISGKINTISALHKFLHSKVHNERISIQSYFKEIVTLYNNITTEYFHVELSIVDIELRSERIVYFGLILNEMLSNTIEHAPDKIGNISLKISKIENIYRFEYKDDSPHKEGDFKGTGTTLIKSLCNRIGGKDFVFTEREGKYQFDFEIIN